MSAEELLRQPEDAYMNVLQRAFFRDLLLTQRRELKRRIEEAFDRLRGYEISSDPADIGSTDEQPQAQRRRLTREQKLLDKIDQALKRLASGEYGWCEESGEPIGLPRLLLRPTATLNLEAKQRRLSGLAMMVWQQAKEARR